MSIRNGRSTQFSNSQEVEHCTLISTSIPQSTVVGSSDAGSVGTTDGAGDGTGDGAQISPSNIGLSRRHSSGQQRGHPNGCGRTLQILAAFVSRQLTGRLLSLVSKKHSS